MPLKLNLTILCKYSTIKLVKCCKKSFLVKNERKCNMIYMLKTAREIVEQLNKKESKSLSILVHGVGKISNVVYHKDDYLEYHSEYWEFNMKLNDVMVIKCQTMYRFGEYLYFEEGEDIEFFGVVYTKWRGMFSNKDVESILIYDAKLNREKRYFAEVFMWNIKKFKFKDMYLAVTETEQGCIDSEIACIGEIEQLENTWAYGLLVKKGGIIILELLNIIE